MLTYKKALLDFTAGLFYDQSFMLSTILITPYKWIAARYMVLSGYASSIVVIETGLTTNKYFGFIKSWNMMDMF